MQWWCSAKTAAWDWSWQPYPGVWAFIALLALGYWMLLRRLDASAWASRRDRRARIGSYAAGLSILWIALDWPVGALGAGYLASAHMVQFLMMALLAPPLILYGVPAAAYLRLMRHPLTLRALRLLTQPLVALALFNLVLIATHWPAVVDGLMVSQLGTFVLDMVWWGGGLVFWWPIVAPVPPRPGFTDLYKVGYLILATILNTPAFALLTFSDLPLYAIFELAPPVAGVSARVDQQVAGLLMKMGGAVVYWTVITILFFQWYRREGRA